MTSSVTISIDAMGGDLGPSVTVPAAVDALREHLGLHIILVGIKSAISTELDKLSCQYDKSRLTIHEASQVVEMDEPVALALRNKKDSSMRVAIDLVKKKTANACVSAGNTGALMATARFVLKTLPGIDRPAIIYSMPIQLDSTPSKMRMLDLGANVDCSGEHLFQFAVMGSILAQAVDGKAPRVGLLNIGSEDIKGSEAVKKAAQLLLNSNLSYIGYVEGTDIFQGSADVVVCDGFVGNVALKVSEGVAGMLLRFIKKEYSRNFFTKCIAWLSLPVLSRIKKQADPSLYNGASLLGLNGIVIKSHGNASRQGFLKAIEEAIQEAQLNIPEKIGAEVASSLNQNI